MKKRTYDTNEIISKLNNIEFINLKKIRVGNVLTVPIFNATKNEVKYSVTLKIMARAILNYKYSVVKKSNNPKIYFLLSSHNLMRKDHYNSFKNVSGLVEERCELIAQEKPYFKLSLKGILYDILIPIWIFQMRSLNIGLKDKLFFAASLAQGLSETNIVYRNIDLNSINLFVSYYDASICESLITQKLNMKNIVTATLQHGHFIKKQPNFTSSLSKNFLAIGNYDKELAIESGLNSEDVYPLGLAKYIGRPEYENLTIKETSLIGVVLDGKEYNVNNKILINKANIIAKKQNKKLVIRCHPGDYIENYSDVVCKDITLVCGENESLENFFERVEFLVIFNSTVFLEAVYNLIPAFRFYGNEKIDTYPYISFGVWSSYKEFEKQYNSFVDNQVQFEIGYKDLRSYIFGYSPSGANYKDYFKKFI